MLTDSLGRQALSELINLLRDLKVDSVDILHKPDNHKAIKVYESLGFKLTESKVDDEVVSNLKL